MHNQKIELDTFALGPDAYEVGEAQANIVLRFFTTVKNFLGDNIQFFTKVFDKIQKEKVQEFYAELFSQILGEFKERIGQQFLSIKLEGFVEKQSEIHAAIFNNVILASLQKCQDIVLSQSTQK